MKIKLNLLQLCCTLVVLLFSSCQEPTAETQQSQKILEDVVLNETLVESFQNIIDSNNVSGSILIYDVEKETYFSNDFERAGTGFLPASTFKVPNSMIGLETGILKDENHLFKWDGEPRRLKQWNADLTLAEAYQVSCVDCYQEVARAIGAKRMNEYLKKFEYGNMEVADSMIDMFWLEGDFEISQKQQITFLKRFYNKSLPISAKTDSIMRKIMVLDDNEDYKLSGKTGWAVRNGNNIGWFIGFIEKDGKVYYIATNITPLDQNSTKDFARIRVGVGLEAFEQLSIL